jgi:tRNA threonylcarbamoyladenosine biosynthesis protein TsaB
VPLPQLEGVLARIENHWVPDAAAIAALASPVLARGEGVDPALAAPIYLRDKVALTVEERRQRKSA